jgi:ABC-type multidrug transport system fused ATPase/permease subunit
MYNNLSFITKIIFYFGFAILTTLLSLIRTPLAFLIARRTGNIIHNQLLRRILLTPLSFHNITPRGFINNFFTGDLTVCDTGLLSEFLKSVQNWLNLIG